MKKALLIAFALMIFAGCTKDAIYPVKTYELSGFEIVNPQNKAGFCSGATGSTITVKFTGKEVSTNQMMTFTDCSEFVVRFEHVDSYGQVYDFDLGKMDDQCKIQLNKGINFGSVSGYVTRKDGRLYPAYRFYIPCP